MAAGIPNAGDFAPDPALWTLRRDWRLGLVSPACSAALDALLTQHGMPPEHMPSTGMAAWFWLRRRLRPGDSINLAGFTHEGWFRHPWAIERALMRGLSASAAPPSARHGSRGR